MSIDRMYSTEDQEFRSSEFKKHGHPIEGCDMIVCWEHDWTDCPKEIEVIALSDVIKELEPQ